MAKNTLSLNDAYPGRGLHSEKWQTIMFNEGGILQPLLSIVKKDPDLVLQIRNNYINIYYKGGNMLKITHGLGYDFDHNYFKGYGIMDEKEQKDERKKILNIVKFDHNFDKFVQEAKKVMNAYWIWLEKKGKSLEEKNEQHYLSVCNNEKTEYTVIDLEFQISTICDYKYQKPTCPSGRKRNEEKCSPRFDIVAVRNSDKRLCVIELKKGKGALSSKNSGVGDHADSFEGSIVRNKKSFISEIKKIVEDKKKLELLSKNFDFKDDDVEFMYAYAFANANTKDAEKENLMNILKKNKCDNYKVIYLDQNTYRLK